MHKHIVFITVVAVALIGLVFIGFFLVDVQDKKQGAAVEAVTGSFGVLEILPREKSWGPKKLDLNGVEIASNDHIGIAQVYPKPSKANYILATEDCGGSACGRAIAIFIDVKSNPEFVAVVSEMNGYEAKIQAGSEGTVILAGVANYITNDLGDYLMLRMRYSHKNKNLRFLPQDGAFDYHAYEGKHPDSLLGDNAARSIFLKKMSPAQFRDLRDNIKTAGPIGVENFGRYVVGSGMAPHMGGDPSAFYVIDILVNKFTAGVYRDGDVMIYTDADNGIAAPDVVDSLLSRYNLRWDQKQNKPVQLAR